MGKKRKRAPNGYRIIQWDDGYYHVYTEGGYCILETLSRRDAIQKALHHKATRQAAPAPEKVAPVAEGGE